MNAIQVNGKSFKVFERQEISGLSNLQAAEPNTVAYLFCESRSRSYLIRELRDGSLSAPVRLS